MPLLLFISSDLPVCSDKCEVFRRFGNGRVDWADASDEDEDCRVAFAATDFFCSSASFLLGEGLERLGRLSTDESFRGGIDPGWSFNGHEGVRCWIRDCEGGIRLGSENENVC